MAPEKVSTESAKTCPVAISQMSLARAMGSRRRLKRVIIMDATLFAFQIARLLLSRQFEKLANRPPQQARTGQHKNRIEADTCIEVITLLADKQHSKAQTKSEGRLIHVHTMGRAIAKRKPVWGCLNFRLTHCPSFHLRAKFRTAASAASRKCRPAPGS